MTLYDQTLVAESEVATYRSANIDDWIAVIDPVLKAAGECTIGSDKVDDVSVSADTVTINTSYSVRCCLQTNSMRIPVSILRADNPIQAATRYRLDMEIADAKNRLASAHRTVTEYSEKVVLLEAERAAISD